MQYLFIKFSMFKCTKNKMIFNFKFGMQQCLYVFKNEKSNFILVIYTIFIKIKITLFYYIIPFQLKIHLLYI